MRYILLIYSNETADAAMSPEEQQAQFNAYMSYAEEIQEKGVLVGGEALLPTSAATSVRVRNGKPLTTHGPFAETAEQLGGYFLVDCANLDEALEWAARIPGVTRGTIEVRPIMEFS
jgi:hypothetical protein